MVDSSLTLKAAWDTRMAPRLPAPKCDTQVDFMIGDLTVDDWYAHECYTYICDEPTLCTLCMVSSL